jgi:uncharacterized membrane protein YqjE
MIQLSQISFLIALVGLGVLLIVQTWPRRRLRPVGVLAAALLLVGWWVVRPGAGGTATAATLEQALGHGQPVVVEVYSDY